MSDHKKCPNCGLINPPEAQRCDCGYDFRLGKVATSYLTSKDVLQGAREAQAQQEGNRILGVLFGRLLGGLFRLFG